MIGRVLADVLGPSTPNLDWLGPTVTSVGAVIVATIGAVSILRRRRLDRQDKADDVALEKAPSETDGWAEVRAARAEASRYYRLYRVFEDLYYIAHSALRHLVRNVHDAHPDQTLGDDVVKALAARPPEDLDKV